MEVIIDRIDFYRDEIEGDEGLLIEYVPTFVSVDYILLLGNKKLEGQIDLTHGEYKGFANDNELIKYIEDEIKKGIQ